MNSRAEQYLARAAECDRLAATTVDHEIKRQLAELARHWRDLATISERRAEQYAP
jgi:hypothetical protein